MKSFNKLFAGMLLIIAAVFTGVNMFFLFPENDKTGRQHIVEINRISREIENGGLDVIDLSQYEYVVGIKKYSDNNFYYSENDYTVREINGELYRFDYKIRNTLEGNIRVWINLIMAAMSVLIIGILLYIRRAVILPFERLNNLPYELSKGNLTIPVKESKNRFFGRFLWGTDMLRESIEQQKKRELDLQREKKTMLLSLSHDIKTPLSAIKLYSKALSKGIYSDRKKQLDIAESIDEKANEIEQFVSQIVDASRENFLMIEVKPGEFYLSDIIKRLEKYYSEKMKLVKTDFSIGSYHDVIIKGDIERSIEALQNIIENALKYGDGRKIFVGFSEEEDCILVSVVNSGNTLSEPELFHIFESFWRGSNSGDTVGNGLGLYICRQIMNKMGGEVFAEIHGEDISVTSVFVKA